MTERIRSPHETDSNRWLSRRNLITAGIGAVATAVPTVFGMGGGYLIGYRESQRASNEEHEVPDGIDVSYPQDDLELLPNNISFVVVAITGGLPTTTNGSVIEQLKWAKENADGGTDQPPIQLYVNTANPGEFIDEIDTWPLNNVDPSGYEPENPYGDCDGSNSLACSWQYGWNRGVEILRMFNSAVSSADLDVNPANYPWWLDVEKENSWQSGSREALERNVATLEGKVTCFQKRGCKVGLYSTHYQWDQIVGDAVKDGSNLNWLDSWLAGASSREDAKEMCSLPGLTKHSKVVMTQRIGKDLGGGDLDYNYSCF